MPDPQKAEIIADTAARMRNAGAIYFTDFRGLSAPQATDLRAQLRAGNIEYIVVKKTLSRLAATEAGLESIDDFLVGQVALAFTSDEPAGPARIFREFSRGNNDVPAITGIVLDGAFLSADRASDLARLPSKEILISQFAAVINQPLTRLVATLGGPMSKLAQLLTGLKDQKTS
ncbi:MAG: 50S ribosomal protein L10 [Candidatus Neomarinimicrobiota bacterium]